MYQLIKTLSNEDIIHHIAASSGFNECDISMESCKVTALIDIPDFVVREQLAKYYGTSTTQIIQDEARATITKKTLHKLVRLISNHESFDAIKIIKAYIGEE